MTTEQTNQYLKYFWSVLGAITVAAILGGAAQMMDMNIRLAEITKDIQYIKQNQDERYTRLESMIRTNAEQIRLLGK